MSNEKNLYEQLATFYAYLTNAELRKKYASNSVLNELLNNMTFQVERIISRPSESSQRIRILSSKFENMSDQLKKDLFGSLAAKQFYDRILRNEDGAHFHQELNETRPEQVLDSTATLMEDIKLFAEQVQGDIAENKYSLVGNNDQEDVTYSFIIDAKIEEKSSSHQSAALPLNIEEAEDEDEDDLADIYHTLFINNQLANTSVKKIFDAIMKHYDPTSSSSSSSNNNSISRLEFFSMKYEELANKHLLTQTELDQLFEIFLTRTSQPNFNKKDLYSSLSNKEIDNQVPDTETLNYPTKEETIYLALFVDKIRPEKLTAEDIYEAIKSNFMSSKMYFPDLECAVNSLLNTRLITLMESSLIFSYHKKNIDKEKTTYLIPYTLMPPTTTHGIFSQTLVSANSEIYNREEDLKILNLPNDADLRDIRKAYFKMLMATHPDKIKDKALNKQSLKIIEAYKRLCNSTSPGKGDEIHNQSTRKK